MRELDKITRKKIEELLKKGRMLVVLVKNYSYGYTLVREIHYYMAFGKVKKVKPLEERAATYMTLGEAVDEIMSMKPRIRYIKIVAYFFLIILFKNLLNFYFWR